jgi:DNA transformation protein and related proteins
MAVSPEYLEFVLEQLRRVASVRSKRMFGEIGLYADDVFVAVIAEDVLYFKVDDRTRARYLERGSEAFMPSPDMPSMNYFSVPEDVLEDSDELRVWLKESIGAAQRKKKRK